MDYIKLFKKMSNIKQEQDFISKVDFSDKMQQAKQEARPEDTENLPNQYIQLSEDEIKAIEKFGISRMLKSLAREKYASFKNEVPQKTLLCTRSQR